MFFNDFAISADSDEGRQLHVVGPPRRRVRQFAVDTKRSLGHGGRATGRQRIDVVVVRSDPAESPRVGVGDAADRLPRQLRPHAGGRQRSTGTTRRPRRRAQQSRRQVDSHPIRFSNLSIRKKFLFSAVTQRITHFPLTDAHSFTITIDHLSIFQYFVIFQIKNANVKQKVFIN